MKEKYDYRKHGDFWLKKNKRFQEQAALGCALETGLMYNPRTKKVEKVTVSYYWEPI